MTDDEVEAILKKLRSALAERVEAERTAQELEDRLTSAGIGFTMYLTHTSWRRFQVGESSNG